jgi:hypothetical protein
MTVCFRFDITLADLFPGGNRFGMRPTDIGLVYLRSITALSITLKTAALCEIIDVIDIGASVPVGTQVEPTQSPCFIRRVLPENREFTNSRNRRPWSGFSNFRQPSLPGE